MSSSPHRHRKQLADEEFVLAVVQLLSFPRPLARGLVLLSAVNLALPVAEPRLVAAGAQPQRPRRSSFGLAGEAGWDGHRGWARVVFFSCGDLFLLITVVRVNGVFEAHERQ